MDESAYFVFALVGALLGYIVGDLQRELRLRGDVRKNLARAVDRGTNDVPDVKPVLVPGPHLFADSRGDLHVVPVTGTNSHRDGNSSSGGTNGRYRNGAARRRAVSRPDFRDRSDTGVRGGGVRRTAPQALVHDCG